ncbi:hypothetical protein [Rhodobacter sp. TJ_12]|uniref:hypothetical protein n=1 Tax=Rhodobacter sp. TJ_12 TaxID=2029399 RepID=UPI001CBCC1DB|nr:hypothetical protein [Rhodobacter sp. TJ_12]
MIRFAMILAMLASPVAGAPPRRACDWLALADPGAVLGAPVSLTPGFARGNDEMRVSLCTATTDAGDSLALLYRSTPGQGGQSGADLIAAYRAELAEVMSPPPELEEIALGTAAVWEGRMHQLTVWSHGGAAMMVLTLFGPQARARCVAAARAILAAGG